MRMSLRWKVTLALVAFGLIPAGIVAAFAYASTDDFIEKQNLIIRRAAATIGDRVVSVIQKNPDHLSKPEKDSKDASRRRPSTGLQATMSETRSWLRSTRL